MSIPSVLPRLQNCGWASTLREFIGTPSNTVIQALTTFIADCGPEQVSAWQGYVERLQGQCRALVTTNPEADQLLVLLEYEIPRESRRPDVLLIGNGVALVIEFKGYATLKKAFTDQVFAYARDLNSYHRDLENTKVSPVLALSARSLVPLVEDGVLVIAGDDLGTVLADTFNKASGPAFDIAQFLEADAYRPLPTLVRAARELFAHRPLPTIKRAAAATDPAVQRISEIAHEAASTRTRHLLLVSGVPGSGKTLVGLRAVHAGYLDDLAIPRNGKLPTAPAVFLSGNGPLVAVLQDALKAAGGGGKVFVRDVKNYVKSHARGSVPQEHMLVSDEAQRAWDADQVALKHDGPNQPEFKSEPELFIDFAERIPEWCVFVGLIGTGQGFTSGRRAASSSGVTPWSDAQTRVAGRFMRPPPHSGTSPDHP